MAVKDSQFQFFWNESKRTFLVEKYHTTDKRQLMDLIQKDIFSDKITDNSIVEDPDKQYKIARAKIAEAKSEHISKKEKLQTKHLELENEILERSLNYHNTFNSAPSKQANSAIRKGVETRELTQQEYENVNKYITVKKIPAGLYPKWEGKCDFCKEGEIYDTIPELKNDMVRHLTTEHAKKVMIL